MKHVSEQMLSGEVFPGERTLSEDHHSVRKQSMQLLCSTGAFTRYPEFPDYRAILEYGPLFDVDGFEVIFLPNWYPYWEQVVNDLVASGLRFPAVHTEKQIGIVFGSALEQDQEQGLAWFATNCTFAQQIGAKTVVLHLWGWPQSDEHLERNLQPLQRCLDIAAEHDVLLAIETIPCKISTPLENVERAVKRDPRCAIALDTEFLANHGQLFDVFNKEWAWEHQRVRHIHIKDFDGQAFLPDGKRRYLHPGEGNIDFTRFFQALRQSGFDGAISLESPALDSNGKLDRAKIEASLLFLRSFL
jgi:sugar phosphate isomerase/epimerase